MNRVASSFERIESWIDTLAAALRQHEPCHEPPPS